MKKTTNNPATVMISAATAEAICNLLYSENGGVDMSRIIDDLGGGVVNKLNVGLVMKGMKPKINESPREYDKYDPTYRRVLVNYSLINNKVDYRVDHLRSDGTWYEGYSTGKCTLEEWESYDIWEDPAVTTEDNR